MVMWSDFTPYQRELIAELADAGDWVPMKLNHQTERKLCRMDVLVVSRIDEPRVKITERGKAIYRDVIMVGPSVQNFDRETVETIIRLYRDGMTYQAIAERIGGSVNSIGWVVWGETRMSAEVWAEIGEEPREKQPNAHPENLRWTVLEMIRQGMRYADIADEMDIPRSTVASWALKYGASSWSWINDEERDKIIELVEDGATYKETAEIVGRSVSSIAGVMKRYWRQVG